MAKSLASDSMSLASTPSTTNLPGVLASCSRNNGNSSRHGMQYEAQKLSTTGFPAIVGEAHRLPVEGLQGEVGRTVADARASGDHARGDDRRRGVVVVRICDHHPGDHADREHDDDRDPGEDPAGPARAPGVSSDGPQGKRQAERRRVSTATAAKRSAR